MDAIDYPFVVEDLNPPIWSRIQTYEYVSTPVVSGAITVALVVIPASNPRDSDQRTLRVLTLHKFIALLGLLEL
mgnify:CR=1 FL=1